MALLRSFQGRLRMVASRRSKSSGLLPDLSVVSSFLDFLFGFLPLYGNINWLLDYGLVWRLSQPLWRNFLSLLDSNQDGECVDCVRISLSFMAWTIRSILTWSSCMCSRRHLSSVLCKWHLTNCARGLIRASIHTISRVKTSVNWPYSASLITLHARIVFK